MTTRIHKYNLDLEEFPSVDMPKGAKILHFNNQRESLAIWAEVDANAPAFEITRRFQIVGTGKNIQESDKRSYIGTALFQGGSLVWHLYEIL